MAKTIEALIDRQIQRSEMLRRAASGTPPTPCIAISRQPGCGAAEVGRRVAERLGYEFYDRDLVDQVANQARVQRQLVEALDEHVRVGIERFASDAFRDARFREGDYVRCLVHTVASLGEHGGAVLLGRGASVILRPERTLRVLLVAPREARVKRLMAEAGLGRDAASQRIDHEARHRSEFLEHHFHVDSDDPGLYDLVLNTDSLGLDGSEELMLRAFEQRFPLARPRAR